MYRTQDNGAPGSPVASSPDEAKETQRLEQVELTPQAPGAGEVNPPVKQKKAPRSRLRKLLLGAVVVVGAGVASWFGYDYWTVGRFTVSTDDAYVQAYNTTLAAKVAGYVASVPVHRQHLRSHRRRYRDHRRCRLSARRQLRRARRSRPRRRPSRGWVIKSPPRKPPSKQAKTQLVSAQAAARRTAAGAQSPGTCWWLSDASSPSIAGTGASQPRPGCRRA